MNFRVAAALSKHYLAIVNLILQLFWHFSVFHLLILKTAVFVCNGIVIPS